MSSHQVQGTKRDPAPGRQWARPWGWGQPLPRSCFCSSITLAPSQGSVGAYLAPSRARLDSAQAVPPAAKHPDVLRTDSNKAHSLPPSLEHIPTYWPQTLTRLCVAGAPCGQEEQGVGTHGAPSRATPAWCWLCPPASQKGPQLGSSGQWNGKRGHSLQEKLWAAGMAATCTCDHALGAMGDTGIRILRPCHNMTPETHVSSRCHSEGMTGACSSFLLSS